MILALILLPPPLALDPTPPPVQLPCSGCPAYLSDSGSLEVPVTQGLIAVGSCIQSRGYESCWARDFKRELEAEMEQSCPPQPKASTGRKVSGIPSLGLSQARVATAPPPEPQLPLPLAPLLPPPCQSLHHL